MNPDLIARKIALMNIHKVLILNNPNNWEKIKKLIVEYIPFDFFIDYRDYVNDDIELYHTAVLTYIWAQGATKCSNK